MDLAQAVVNNDWFVLSLVLLVHDSLKCLIMWVIPFLLSSFTSFLQYIHSAQQHQIVFEFHLSFFFFYIQLVKMIPNTWSLKYLIFLSSFPKSPSLSRNRNCVRSNWDRRGWGRARGGRLNGHLMGTRIHLNGNELMNAIMSRHCW